MRAARITELGAPPELAEVEGDGAIEVLAVALNPLDLAVGSGRFYGGHPDLPYVPGAEAVGRLADGRRVYMFGAGYGVRRDGFLVERTDFPPDAAADVPDGLDDALAAATGVVGIAAWVPVAWKAPVRPDDRVLVLGATGMVGLVAVQAARLLGAERVVAAGRNEQELERALQHGADATVRLEGEGLVERMRGACGGDGPTLVVDPLWGEPARAAVDAAAHGARIVNLGQSAGPEATLTSAAVRGKQLAILGHANVAMDPAERKRAYAEIAEHVAAGRIRIEVETFPLDQVAAAWSAQAAGRKAVVVL
ncbi:MAG TPA: zinc-binding alcohol dehydrogenase family protein [Gaiellaceae bacterium]|nr:zinc-binding alcohol dehydrogenase family protein [Gaiellaceae bacterium]